MVIDLIKINVWGYLKALLRYLSNAVHLQNSFNPCTEGFLKRFNYSHTLGSNHSISGWKPKY